ncbi:MAG: Por secretion system protein, partial [Muribaculaceae bacterium]
AKNYILSDGNDQIAAYAKFADVVFPTDAEKYDVTCIATVFGNGVQVYPISFKLNSGISDVETGSTSIVAVNGAININAEKASEVLVVDAAGKVVAQKAIVAGENTIEVAGGFYIVKVANKVAKVIVK